MTKITENLTVEKGSNFVKIKARAKLIIIKLNKGY